jgi:transmembrane sensor
MKKVNAPLPELNFDDATAVKLWRGIVAKRSREKRMRAIGSVTRGAMVVGALGVGIWMHRTHSHPIDAHVTTTTTHAALALEGGAAIDVLAAAEAPRTFTFNDASHIELARGARLVPHVNDASAFVSSLHGAGTFDVTPGGARRWSVECEDVTVDVIGTRFHVEEKDGHVHVAVDHGIVVVRGDRVANHLQRLVDGESIDIDAKTNAANLPITPASIASTQPQEIAPLPTSISNAATATHPTIAEAKPDSWQSLAQAGKYAAAYDALRPVGLVTEASRASVDDLFMLADVARLSAHPADAVGPLTRILDEHPNDSRASLAAFSRGRLELDALASPAAAANSFARAIAIGLPSSLEEDAYVRLVEARMRAGDRKSATRAQDDYAAKFPHGTRADSIARWLREE